MLLQNWGGCNFLVIQYSISKFKKNVFSKKKWGGHDPPPPLLRIYALKFCVKSWNLHLQPWIYIHLLNLHDCESYPFIGKIFLIKPVNVSKISLVFYFVQHFPFTAMNTKFCTCYFDFHMFFLITNKFLFYFYVLGNLFCNIEILKRKQRAPAAQKYSSSKICLLM